MKKDYDLLANSILENIGGLDNVETLTHCQTRLRFVLKDASKANTETIEKIDGVLKVINGVQYQVVIGTDVKFVYDKLVAKGILTNGSVTEGDAPKEKKSIGNIISEYMFSIFQPLIPYLIGSGMLKALLAILVLCGLDNTGSTYTVINSIADAAYYFLPIAVAITTAERLKCNKLLAVACVSTMLIPSMTTQLSEGATLFGIGLQNVTYAYQVFPAILCVFMYAFMEKITTKYVPHALSQVLVPLISMLVTCPITLIILGPLGYMVGQVIVTAILFIYAKIGWLAVGLLASILPIMIGTGMHKALVPYTVATVTSLGYEMLYLPASLAHNFGECGTCLAVAFRTKDKKIRETALECLIPSLTAVQEPTLYSITMPYKRTLIGTMIGSFISGCIVGLMQIKAFLVAGPNFSTLGMWLDPSNNMNFVYALIGIAISIASCFICVAILYKDPEKESENE